MYIIGVDIGTTNTKAIACTPEGAILAQASRTYAPLDTPASHHELDPDTILEAVVYTVRQVLVQAGEELPAGVAFSSAMHSLMAVNANGKPLTPLITWADLRSHEQAGRLKQMATGRQIYEHTGTPVHPMSPLCKLLWMREEQPAMHAAAHKFIGIKEYIFYRFFGEYLVDHSVASATGLFDIYSFTWYAPALEAAGITEKQLSHPVSTSYTIKGLQGTYADQLSALKDIPFIAGASDGCLANLGSGAMQPGDLSITIGTSGAVRMTTSAPQYDPQQRLFNYILTEQLYISGGPVNNGASLIRWSMEHLFNESYTGTADVDQYIHQAAMAPPGADGLVFLPYVQGERAPVWDAAARGVFFGIGGQHQQTHFKRAIVEGINYSLFEVAQSVVEVIGPVQHIYASGGFTHSPAWIQWMADLFGQPVQLAGSADASATGAALLGWFALGIRSSLSFAGKQEPATILEYEPVATNREAYLRNYAVYKSLYPRLKDAFLPS